MIEGRVGRAVIRRVVKEGRAGAYLRSLAAVFRPMSDVVTNVTTSARPLSNSLQMLLRALCRAQ